MIWTGICGFGKGRARAFADVQAVEVQQTFYRPVNPAMARRWREAAPDGFRFAVKASQFITHEASSPTYRRSGRAIPASEAAAYGSFRDTEAVREGWEATTAVAEALAASVIVFQTPASFGPTEAHVRDLYRFFEAARSEAVRALELRGSWPTHLVETLCEDLELVHAVDPFAREAATAGLAYFRLHGSPPGPTMYRHRYTDVDLARLRAIAEEYDDAYVMFNNVSMQEDAVRFRSLGAADRGPASESPAASRAERFL